MVLDVRQVVQPEAPGASSVLKVAPLAELILHYVRRA
jgi:hypothetical protein